MRHLSILCILFACSVLQAQNYNLNNYKYRYQKWQLMGFNFNFQGGHNQANFKTENTILNSQQKDTVITEEQDYNLHNFSLVTPLFFSRFINTEKLQQTQNFSYSARIDKMKGLYNYNTNLSSRQDLDYKISNRFYKGRNFTELNFGTNNNFNTNFTKYNPGPAQRQDQSRISYYTLSYDLSFGFGRGRLEYVSDAVSAMFLLKDLQSKAGTGNYSNEQIEAVAKGITRITNARYMDFRFGLIDQLTMLDSVLKANNIVSNNSIRYFTTINDNWLYAQRFGRYSGSRWSVSALNRGSLSKQKQNETFSDSTAPREIKFYGGYAFHGLGFNFINSRQIGLYIQQNFGFGFSSGVDFNTNEWSAPTSSKVKFDHINHIVHADWGYLYQPNTRTYLNFSIEGNASLQDDLNGMRTANSSDQHSSTLYTSISTNLNFFRFISPKLYYNSSFAFTYSYQRNQLSNIYIINNKGKNTFLPFSFNMGLTYLLF